AGGSSSPAPRTGQVLPAPVVPATPTIAVVAADDVVTPSEAKAGVAIRGTATGGDTVTVDWQGRGKTATANARGDWSVFYANDEVPSPGTTTVRATASNAGGSSAPATRTVRIDAEEAPVVTLDPVTGDDRVTAVEQRSSVPMAGTAPAGSLVLVRWSRANLVFTKTVPSVPASGRWTVTFTSTEAQSISSDPQFQGPYQTLVTVSAQAQVGGPPLGSIERTVVAD
ncbi:MAG: hypothetical protein AB7O55_34900, partial [Lautropia sp.]